MRVKNGRCRMPIGACSEFRDNDCGKFCYYNTILVRTRFDDIREMDVDEMAIFLSRVQNEVVADCGGELEKRRFPSPSSFPDGWIDWLKQGGEL